MYLSGRAIALLVGQYPFFLWHASGFKLASYETNDAIAALNYSPNGEYFLVAFKNGIIQVFPTYTYNSTQLGTLNWKAIDLLGYEAPIAYWLAEKNANLLNFSLRQHCLGCRLIYCQWVSSP